MLNPRGYSPAYAFEIYSHRLLRYLTPLAAPDRARRPTSPCSAQGSLYAVTMALQLGLLLAAALGRFVPLLPLRIAYYYVTVTASIAVGLWDRIRAGRRPGRLGEGRGDAVSARRAGGLPAGGGRA